MKSNKIAILPVILLVFGCSGGGGASAPSLVSIAVTPASPAIARGTTQQFAATGTFSDNSTSDVTSKVTWTSALPGVASIGPTTGLATSLTTGTTTITATSGAVSGFTTLTVTTAALVSIAVTPANPTIAIGTTQQFTATGSLLDSTTQNLTTSVTWSSSNSRVATINATGLATPLVAGTSTITAASGSIPGSTLLTVSVPAGGNVLPVTVNGSLCSSAFNATYPNKPCVSVTVCTPGTATCQTISDILLDTGSYGLRIFNQVLTVPLTQVTVPSGSLAECVRFADLSSDWGPVQSADVVLGGEPAVTVPIHVINAGFGTVPTGPSGCVQMGGSLDASPSDAKFNGILGVGLLPQDCGPACVSSTSPHTYFACTGASCIDTTVPLASQVQNPVVLLPLDNNGVLVQLPVVPLGGQASVNGQLVLGINTRANNVPTGVTALPANLSAEFLTDFNGATNIPSFIDSGSNGFFFSDTALAQCAPWYCPPTTQSFTATTKGAAGSPSVVVPFQIGNATNLFNSGNHVFIELGGSIPSLAGFDWGLPFFLGKNVFVGIQGKSSSLGTGPLWAY